MSSSRMLLALVLPLPLGGCMLTELVWKDFGGTPTEEAMLAHYDVDSTGTLSGEPNTVVLHAVQTSGSVASPQRATCAGDTWLLLRPERDADIALALRASTVFDIEAATCIVEHAKGRVLLTVRVGADRLGRATEPAALPGARLPASSHREVDTMAACERDLLAVDWSFVAGTPLAQDVSIAGWTGPDGTRLMAADGSISSTADPAPPRLTALGGSDQLAGARVQLRATTADGRPLELDLDASAAWVYAHATRTAGGGDRLVHASEWHVVLQRDMPAALVPTRATPGWRVAVHSHELRTASGESFGTTMVRVLATPFAVAGDVVTGALIVAIAAFLSDDDDC